MNLLIWVVAHTSANIFKIRLAIERIKAIIQFIDLTVVEIVIIEYLYISISNKFKQKF